MENCCPILMEASASCRTVCRWWFLVWVSKNYLAFQNCRLEQEPSWARRWWSLCVNGLEWRNTWRVCALTQLLATQVYTREQSLLFSSPSANGCCFSHVVITCTRSVLQQCFTHSLYRRVQKLSYLAG